MGRGLSLFSLPVKELEFNKIGNTGREIGEVFKSGSTGIQDNQCDRFGDLWIAVGDVGRTPTAMTHKPTARPRETQLEMLVDSDQSVSWATSQHESTAIPRLELSIGLHASA